MILIVINVLGISAIILPSHTIANLALSSTQLNATCKWSVNKDPFVPRSLLTTNIKESIYIYL